jgi:hypothetical protein
MSDSDDGTFHFNDTDLCEPPDSDFQDWLGSINDVRSTGETCENVEVEVRDSSELALHGTFPNPFQEQATVRYSVPERMHVRLAVYDALGRRVRTLVDEQQEGRQEASFQAQDLSSGTYFYRLEAGGRVLTGSVVLVR